MRAIRICIAVYLSLLISFIVNFFFSEAGFVDYQQLTRYKAELEKNIQDIKEINTYLAAELHTLRTDKELVRILSRELGYYAADERVIKVNGLEKRQSSYKVGNILSFVPQGIKMSDKLKILLLCLPLVVYLLLGVLRKIISHGRNLF